MKKIASLLLVVTMITLLFASCSGPAKIKVNEVKVDNEIYTYFEDSLDESLSKSEKEEAIKKSISRYVTINSEFNNRGLSLSSTEKKNISTSVNNIWHLFGAHYDDIGVSKQSLYKIEESKACEKALLNFYYSDKGASPVGEDQIKAYFNENYVAVRLVTGYLFNVDENGASVPMTDDQKNNLVNSFSSVATMVNSGSSLEESVSSLGTGTEIRDSLIHAKDSGTLPDGFFSAAKAIETGKAAAISLGDYIFLVQRIDVFNEEFGYYGTYRTDCLQKMKGEEFSKIIDKWSESYIAK